MSAAVTAPDAAEQRLVVDALLSRILASLEDDRAEDVVAIDLRGRSEMADHMVIASGRSSRQVAAISEHLTDRLRETGVRSKVEGADQGDWVLIDAGDVIVHVFRPEVREFYQLEKMWMPTGTAKGAARDAAPTAEAPLDAATAQDAAGPDPVEPARTEAAPEAGEADVVPADLGAAHPGADPGSDLGSGEAAPEEASEAGTAEGAPRTGLVAGGDAPA